LQQQYHIADYDRFDLSDVQ